MDRLQEYRTMTSLSAHVVGTKPKEHAVVTGLGKDFHERGLEDSALVHTNHYVGHEKLLKHNGPARWTDDDGQEWCCDSHIRQKTLGKRLKTVPASLAESRRKICSAAVTTEDAVQQMLFQP